MNIIESNTRELIASIPEYVTLVAAAKTRTCQEVLQAVRGGLRHIGHNYMQQALAMKEGFREMLISAEDKALLDKCKWHFIGHLQSNKVKKAVENFDFIQTVDSVKLINLIQKEAAKQSKTVKVMLELNIGDEENKSGAPEAELDELVKEAQKRENIDLCGLMTMGSFMATEEQTKTEYRKARKIFESLFPVDPPKGSEKRNFYLSMGMSGSYEAAILNGSNMIRIGTSLFGQRY